MKRKAGMIISTIVLIVLVLILGPMDCLKHGYYCNELNYDMLKQDLESPIKLEQGAYEMKFSPTKRHMVGVEINLLNVPKKGKLILDLFDEDGKEVDTVKVNLKKVSEQEWYKVVFNKELNKGKVYTLRFTAEKCKKVPYLQTIYSGYLSEESMTGNVLIGYAYAKSTFTLQNKVLIILFLVAVWLFILSKMSTKDNLRRVGILAATILFTTALFSWNYMYNSMDDQNTTFDGFDAFSERLVRGVVDAEHYGVWYEDNETYGLAFLKGKLNEYTDEVYWLRNYSMTTPAVVVDSDDYSKQYAVTGNYILFENGEKAEISNVEDDGTKRILYLDAERVLNPYKYGELSEATYCDSNQNPVTPVEKLRLSAYKSQYGLHGKIYRHIARYMNYDNAIENLHLISSILTALVFSVIVVLLAFKYNKVFAGVFFITFWLSPWTVNFANNLYWVEFSWFVPMAIGIFCSCHVENRKCRMASYVLTFFAILIKCLCGYEYISTIMIALVAFLTVDWVKAIITKDKKKTGLLFRTIILMGIMALLGFVAAISIHAPMRGDGSIIEGIKTIFREDILRRTSGANLNDMDPVLWPSLNASVWETFCKYFHFKTEIVAGINGNLFPLLCMVPLIIFGYEIKYKKENAEHIAMYIIFFFAATSWFCLAKGHSFIHTPMNFVLWYFGFVQICFYVIIEKIIRVFQGRIKEDGKQEIHRDNDRME